MIDISTIIVSYNTAHLLGEAVGKLKAASHGLSLECIFVDNASADQSAAYIRQHFPGDLLIENQTNVGFGRANNQALPHVHGRYVLLLNTDAFVAPDTLTKTVEYMDQHPDCGILGVRLEGADGSLQPCARYFPTPWNTFIQRTGLHKLFSSTRLVDDMEWDHASVRECDWVVGCYYLVRKEVITQVGLFDPRYFLYFEEVDHCFSAKKAGWKVVFYPHTTVIHLGGESAKSSGAISKSGKQLSVLQVESEVLFMRKNHGLSGLLLHTFLTAVADLVQTLKRLIKPRGLDQLKAGWLHSKLFFSLIVKTRGGVHPTR